MDTQHGQNTPNTHQLTWACETVTPTLLQLDLPHVSGAQHWEKALRLLHEQKVLWWPWWLYSMWGNWRKLQRDSLPDSLHDSLPDSLSASPGRAQRILNAWTSIGSHKAPLPRRGKRLYADPGVVCCRHACGSFHCWCHYPYSSVTTNQMQCCISSLHGDFVRQT